MNWTRRNCACLLRRDKCAAGSCGKPNKCSSARVFPGHDPLLFKWPISMVALTTCEGGQEQATEGFP